MKRIIPIAIALALCLSIIVPVCAAEPEEIKSGVCGKNLTWTLDSEGTLIISGAGEMDDFYINATGGESGFYVYSNIPWVRKTSDSDDFVGVNISENSFADYIKNIELSADLTSIGTYAFYGCAFTEISIPENIRAINTKAFSRCDHLTDVYYAGDKIQWDTIEVAEGNEALLNATIHFNVTSQDVNPEVESDDPPDDCTCLLCHYWKMTPWTDQYRWTTFFRWWHQMLIESKNTFKAVE